MVQFFPLLCCDLSVFAFSDPVQGQIHDPDPFQLLYLISQIPAHSADLPVQSLCQNDPKAAFSCLHHSAWSGHCIKNRDSLAHPSDKFPVHRLIHCHKICFLMIISGPHHFIQDLPVIRHQKQAFRVPIQTPYRVQALRYICHQFCNAPAAFFVLHRRHKATGFMQHIIQRTHTADHRFAVYCDSIFFCICFIAQLHWFAVATHTPLCDQLLCLAP